ncbi:MAG: Cu2+-exporting ATPase, partial [Planctomycetota bacterium]
CPACVWLIESRLSQMQGVKSISVSYSTQRAQVEWDDAMIHLSDILQSIARLGYKARPSDISQGLKQLDDEQKYQWRRLGLAGVLGMQVMMLSIALYVGDEYGIEARFRTFFTWVSLLLTTPVIFYSAQTFFSRAWRDLRLKRTGMDVPVSFGIIIAFSSSIWATTTGVGQVYYDSIVMFIFLLLCARYFEFRARRRSALYINNIGQLLPTIATRLVKHGDTCNQETVAIASLALKDVLLIRPGDVIPADGFLLEGKTTVDESLLSGESQPVLKSCGDFLVGGSSNIDQPVEMGVSRLGKDTMCSHIYRLMEQGQRVKPELLALSNRISAWFVFSILVIAVLTAWYWLLHDVSMWIPVTISVLVVSCPCALSLATPVALATASTALLKHGVVLVNTNAIEALSKVTTYVFDKTGTLTSDRMTITKTTCLSSMPQAQCLAVAAAIEENSSHPLAKAFVKNTPVRDRKHAECICNYPGEGITGRVDGIDYFLGTDKFVTEKTGLKIMPVDIAAAEETCASQIVFSDRNKIHCIFLLTDSTRTGARELIKYIQHQHKSISLLSGDKREATETLARDLGLNEVCYGQSPDQKMDHITKMQNKGESVAMIGDGANDAPVLACANVSIAMGDGAALASTCADLILLNSRLDKVVDVINMAANTKVIIRQNISWAILYNVIALPLAVTGVVTPWMAAIGMSLSSLLVVINSGRLNRMMN